MAEMYKDYPEEMRERLKTDDDFRESLGIPKEINKGGRPKGTTKVAMQERRRQEAIAKKNKNKARKDFGALGKQADNGENSKKIIFFKLVSAIGEQCDQASYNSMRNCIDTYVQECMKEDISVTLAGLRLSIGLTKSEMQLWKSGKCTHEQKQILDYIEDHIDMFSETALVEEKGAVAKIYHDKTRNDVVEPTAKDIVRPQIEDDIEATGEQLAEKYAYLTEFGD